MSKIPSKCARFSASEASKTHSFQIHFANNMRLFEIFAYYAMIKLWSNLIFSHRKMRRGFLFFSALEATRCIFPFMKASAGVSVSVKRGVETYTVFKNPWKCLIGMKLSFDQKWDFSWWFTNCMGSSFLFEVEPVWKWNCHTCWRLCHVQDEITWEKERKKWKLERLLDCKENRKVHFFSFFPLMR